MEANGVKRRAWELSHTIDLLCCTYALRSFGIHPFVVSVHSCHRIFSNETPVLLKWCLKDRWLEVHARQGMSCSLHRVRKICWKRFTGRENHRNSWSFQCEFKVCVAQHTPRSSLNTLIFWELWHWEGVALGRKLTLPPTDDNPTMCTT